MHAWIKCYSSLIVVNEKETFQESKKEKGAKAYHHHLVANQACENHKLSIQL